MNEIRPSLPPFARHVGMEMLGAADGEARIRLAARPEIVNRKGDIHGGALMTLLDVVSGNAIRSAAPDATGLSTITQTTSFIAPARGTLLGIGRAVQIGGSVAFAEARVEDETGRVVATAQGSWRIMRARG